LTTAGDELTELLTVSVQAVASLNTLDGLITFSSGLKPERAALKWNCGEFVSLVPIPLPDTLTVADGGPKWGFTEIFGVLRVVPDAPQAATVVPIAASVRTVTNRHRL
jgi:hypothetical protein